MGILQNLEEAIAYRLPEPALFEWIQAISKTVDGLGPPFGLVAQVRYVTKGGNDATGNGSLTNPFLTVQAAITSITDATSVKPYTVSVAPGVYATPFLLAPNIYVVGSGSGAGEYNATPLTGVTVLAPTVGQCLSAAFAGAGTLATGIMQAALSTALTADFAAIGSTGAGTIFLDNLITESAISVIGAVATNYARIQAVYFNKNVALTLTNLGGSSVQNCANDFGGGIVHTQSAAIQGFHQVGGSTFQSCTVTWTSALLANLITVNIKDGTINNPVITGLGANVFTSKTISLVATDAANRLSVGGDATATLIGVTGGTNIVKCTPTAARLLTIVRPNVVDTTYIIKNLSTNGSPLDLAFTAGTVPAASPSYVPAGGELTFIYDAASATWLFKPIIQSGVATLINGVSAAIAADITANSRILATLKVPNGAAGVPAALTGDLVGGTRAGGGSFKITSVAQATGATVATDLGSYNWIISENAGGA